MQILPPEIGVIYSLLDSVLKFECCWGEKPTDLQMLISSVVCMYVLH